MGRRAEGPKVRWKRGWAYARFTWQQREYCEALGTKDPREAEEGAARAYAEVVSGQRRPVARRPGQLLSLSTLWDEWLDWKRPSIDPETAEQIGYYGDRFVDYFVSLDRITEASGATYGMTRLGQVSRSTVMKELCFLRQFLAWCKQQGALAAEPVIPKLPPKAKGKRVGPQRAKPVEITPEEARAIIARLPLESKTIGGRKWPVRDRFAFAFETMFRPKTVGSISVPEHWRPGMKHVVIADEIDKARFGREVDLSPEALRILKRVAPVEGLIFGRHEFSKALKAAAKAVLGPLRGARFAAYDFRHGMAQALLDAGAPLRGVSYLLGHIRPTTTDRYTRPDRRAGQAAIAAIAGPFSDRKTGTGKSWRKKPRKTG